MTELASIRALDGVRHLMDSECAWLLRITASTPVPALQVIKRGITALKVPNGKCFIRHGVETILFTENILPGTVRCNGSDILQRSVGLRHGDEIQVADTKLAFLADLSDTVVAQTGPGAEKTLPPTHDASELRQDPASLKNEIEQLRRDRDYLLRQGQEQQKVMARMHASIENLRVVAEPQLDPTLTSTEGGSVRCSVEARSILRQNAQGRQNTSVRFEPASRRSHAQPSSHGARLSGSAARRSNQAASPSGQVARQSSHVARPSGVVTRPSGQPVRPSSHGTRPSGQPVRPSGQPVRPSGQVTRSSASDLAARRSGQMRINRSPISAKSPPSTSSRDKSVVASAIAKSKSALSGGKSKPVANTSESGKIVPLKRPTNPGSEFRERDAAFSGNSNEPSRLNPSVLQYRFGAHILHADHLLDGSRPTTTAHGPTHAANSVLPQSVDDTIDGRPVSYGRQSKCQENAEAIRKMLGRLAPRRIPPQVDDVDSDDVPRNSSDEDKICDARWTTQEVDEIEEFVTSVAIDESIVSGNLLSSTYERDMKKGPSTCDDGINTASSTAHAPIGISNPALTVTSAVSAPIPPKSPLMEPSDATRSDVATRISFPRLGISRREVATFDTSDASVPADAHESFGDAAAASATRAQQGFPGNASAESARAAQYGHLPLSIAQYDATSRQRSRDDAPAAHGFTAQRADLCGARARYSVGIEATVRGSTARHNDVDDASSAPAISPQGGNLNDAVPASGITAQRSEFGNPPPASLSIAQYGTIDHGAVAYATPENGLLDDAAAAFSTKTPHGNLGDPVTASGIRAPRGDLSNAPATAQRADLDGAPGEYGTATQQDDAGDSGATYGVAARRSDVNDIAAAYVATEDGSLINTAAVFGAAQLHHNRHCPVPASGITAQRSELNNAPAAVQRSEKNDKASACAVTEKGSISEGTAVFDATTLQGNLCSPVPASGITAQRRDLNNAPAAVQRSEKNDKATACAVTEKGSISDETAVFDATTLQGNLCSPVAAFGITSQRSELNNEPAAVQRGEVDDRAAAYVAKKDGSLGDPIAVFDAATLQGDSSYSLAASGISAQRVDLINAHGAAQYGHVVGRAAAHLATEDDDLRVAAAVVDAAAQQGDLCYPVTASDITTQRSHQGNAPAASQHSDLPEAVVGLDVTQQGNPCDPVTTSGITARHSDSGNAHPPAQRGSLGDQAAVLNDTTQQGDFCYPVIASGVTQHKDVDNAHAPAQHCDVGGKDVAYATTKNSDLPQAAAAFDSATQKCNIGDATTTFGTGARHSDSEKAHDAAEDDNIPNTRKAILTDEADSEAFSRHRNSVASLPAPHVEDAFLKEEESDLARIKARDQRSKEIIDIISFRSSSTGTLDSRKH